jgi:hypothetical protein
MVCLEGNWYRRQRYREKDGGVRSRKTTGRGRVKESEVADNIK